MIVGYVSELNVKSYDNGFRDMIDRLLMHSVNNHLDYLILAGGISSDYHITLSFVEELGVKLRSNNIKLRFIVGNTDFYYPKDEPVFDKTRKFREISHLYNNSPFYLPRNPIITRHVRIVGAESWYDYSLYRGKPRDLKDISRKSVLFFRNLDNRYITSKDDYTFGFNNLFDIQYSRECVDLLRQRLESDIQKHGKCNSSVVVTYFKGSKSLLGNSFVSKYMGTFEGSLDLGRVMKSYSVSSCIVGKRSPRRCSNIDGVVYTCPALGLDPYSTLEVVTYG